MKLDNPFTDPADKLGFSKVLDRYAAHIKNSSDEFTDFLDPGSVALFIGALKKHPIEPVVFGGYAGSERNMIGFCVQDEFFAGEVSQNEHQGLFPIAAISITYNERFSSQPTHRHYLGSLIGLGLDRGKLGDICQTKDGAVAYMHSSIADFVTENLTKVGKTSVKASVSHDIIVPTTEGMSKRLTVSSLRLDAFMSAAYNLSRAKANELIDSQKVFVNFRHEKKTHILKVYDKISVRGLGRAEIISISGMTKKGKIGLIITKYS